MKILLFGIVFVAGIALGGSFRYGQVEAQLSDVEVTASPIPTSTGSLGGGSAGSCG